MLRRYVWYYPEAQSTRGEHSRRGHYAEYLYPPHIATACGIGVTPDPDTPVPEERRCKTCMRLLKRRQADVRVLAAAWHAEEEWRFSPAAVGRAGEAHEAAREAAGRH